MSISEVTDAIRRPYNLMVESWQSLQLRQH
jgi:hypothetical protein